MIFHQLLKKIIHVNFNWRNIQILVMSLFLMLNLTHFAQAQTKTHSLLTQSSSVTLNVRPITVEDLAEIPDESLRQESEKIRAKAQEYATQKDGVERQADLNAQGETRQAFTPLKWSRNAPSSFNLIEARFKYPVSYYCTGLTFHDLWLHENGQDQLIEINSPQCMDWNPSMHRQGSRFVCRFGHLEKQVFFSSQFMMSWVHDYSPPECAGSLPPPIEVNRYCNGTTLMALYSDDSRKIIEQNSAACPPPPPKPIESCQEALTLWNQNRKPSAFDYLTRYCLPAQPICTANVCEDGR